MRSVWGWAARHRAWQPPKNPQGRRGGSQLILNHKVSFPGRDPSLKNQWTTIGRLALERAPSFASLPITYSYLTSCNVLGPWLSGIFRYHAYPVDSTDPEG